MYVKAVGEDKATADKCAVGLRNIKLTERLKRATAEPKKGRNPIVRLKSVVGWG